MCVLRCAGTVRTAATACTAATSVTATLASTFASAVARAARGGATKKHRFLAPLGTPTCTEQTRPGPRQPDEIDLITDALYPSSPHSSRNCNTAAPCDGT
jgi:hypothetical protein